MEFNVVGTTIRINTETRAALMDAVETRLRESRGFALATLNLDHLVKLRRSAAFRTAYAAQDLIVADGNPIVWLSRLAGRKVELLPGADLVLPLARLAAKVGRPVALVGSTEAALLAAQRAISADAPGISIIRTIAPSMGFDPQGDEALRILQEVQAAGVGLCFIALGAPRQEELAARGRQVAPNVGFASIGAGLDFLGGEQVRAPRLIRRLSLEWLWRAAGNPKRLVPRYVACAAILPSEVVAALKQR